MTSPKPDYLIAANGLPNILNTRHMIRQTQNRMQPKDSKSLRKSSSVNKCHKDKRNFMNISKAPATVLDRNKLNISTKSQKDLINEEIKSTNSHRCDISSSTFLSTSSQKIEADNKCNSLNIERWALSVQFWIWLVGTCLHIAFTIICINGSRRESLTCDWILGHSSVLNSFYAKLYFCFSVELFMWIFFYSFFLISIDESGATVFLPRIFDRNDCVNETTMND